MSEPTRHEHALRRMLKTANIQIGEMQADADARDKEITELRSAIKSHNARVKSDCERRCRANQIYGKHRPTECPLEYEIDVKAQVAESEATG